MVLCKGNRSSPWDWDDEVSVSGSESIITSQGRVAATEGRGDKAPPPASARLRYIDALRGVAATGVMLFHFSGHRICRELNRQLPQIVPWIFRHGDLGVQIFFVISGFVIAYSVRGHRMNGRFLGRFALRRSIRLDPPYWFTIAAVIATGFFSKYGLGNRDVSLPTVGQVVAHVFYCYQILGYDDIYPVFWTLCHEVQFYLIFIVLLGIGQRLTRPEAAAGRINGVALPWVMLLFAMPTILSASGWFQYPGLCLDTWYLFGLGVLAYGVVFGQLPWQVFAGVCLCVAGINLDMEQVEPAQKAMGLITAVSFVLIGLRGHLRDWGDVPALQFLGRISYSLYLIHGVVGYRLLSVGDRLTGANPWFAVGWFAAALCLSVVTASWMYRCIEAPSIALARRWRWVRT